MTDIPTISTPEELLALDARRRLTFFLGLEKTSPEIATFVIYTVVNDVRPAVAVAYYERLKHLVNGADPLQVFVLSSRFVNTARAPRERLAIHQYMVTELNRLLTLAGYAYTYVRAEGSLRFFGTLSRRTALACDEELHERDMAVYNRANVVPKHRSANGRWPEVKAHRVEIEDVTLPATLGLTRL